MKIKFIATSLISIALIFASCNASRTAKGGAIGAGAGALIGGVIGNASGNTATGAIIGAAVGGTAGALIGRRMDKQAEELRNDLEGAQVERVGEGIKITFNSGLMFATNSFELNSNTRSNLDDLAATLIKYDDTDILIEGHTDSSGAEDHNQTLSERRANAVTTYLLSKGVASNRLNAVGYGENQPIADNESASGREVNRRVEVAIYANEKMKKAAKRGDL